MSTSATDRAFVKKLVDENGWEAACLTLLRRARLAENESRTFRRDLDDLSAGWRPLMVRVRERLLSRLGEALIHLLSQFEAIQIKPKGLNEAVHEAQAAVFEWRTLFPKEET